MLSISAVMPDYDEEDNVGPMIKAMVAIIAPFELWPEQQREVCAAILESW